MKMSVSRYILKRRSRIIDRGIELHEKKFSNLRKKKKNVKHKIKKVFRLRIEWVAQQIYVQFSKHKTHK